jgi:hypothetical protein
MNFGTKGPPESWVNEIVGASLDGTSAYEYRVVFTAESVMLVFGLLPGQHRTALESLIQSQGDQWRSDENVAALAGAKLALGLPSSLAALGARLEAASEDKKSVASSAVTAPGDGPNGQNCQSSN